MKPEIESEMESEIDKNQNGFYNGVQQNSANKMAISYKK